MLSKPTRKPWSKRCVRWTLCTIALVFTGGVWWWRIPPVESICVGPFPDDFYAVPRDFYFLGLRVNDFRLSRRLKKLSNAAIENEDLRSIARLQPREVLLYDCPHITDQGVQYLAEMPDAITLELARCPISGECLKELGKMKTLSTLCLVSCPVSDSALRHLTNLESLRSLDLSGCPISDAGLGHLPLERLTRLSLQDTPITNVSLANLSRMRNGTVLDLSGTKLTDDGLVQIEALAKRLRIYVDDSGLSPEGRRRIIRIQSDFNINPLPTEKAATDIGTDAQ